MLRLATLARDTAMPWRPIALCTQLVLGTALAGQYPSPTASPRQLAITRVADAGLGIVQHRTKPVRLAGSGIGQAWVGLDLARNERVGAEPSYLLILTIVDTLPFGTQPGPSLLVVVDGDSIRLSGPGDVASRLLTADRSNRPRGVPLLSYKYSHLEVAPFPLSAELLDRLARGTRVSFTIHGAPWSTRRPNDLTRRMQSEGLAPVRGFRGAWADSAAEVPLTTELGVYIPAD